MQTPEVLVVILSLFGILIEFLAGIFTANKLITYKIAESKKKVDKHNTIIEQFASFGAGR